MTTADQISADDWAGLLSIARREGIQYLANTLGLSIDVCLGTLLYHAAKEVAVEGKKLDTVVLHDWVIEGEHCPVVEIWEFPTLYAQYHRNTGRVRYATKTSNQVVPFGEWQKADAGMFN